jgi:hypothetical protein
MVSSARVTKIVGRRSNGRAERQNSTASHLSLGRKSWHKSDLRPLFFSASPIQIYSLFDRGAALAGEDCLQLRFTIGPVAGGDKKVGDLGDLTQIRAENAPFQK